MNAVEHIVESYYRYILRCYTVTDVKIEKGVGRQIDILAYQPATHKFFHVECSVTHVEKWNPHAIWLAKLAEYKFCGYPRPKAEEPFEGSLEEEKAVYQGAIYSAYETYGSTNPSLVQRVWCTWIVQDPENLEDYRERFRRKHGFSFSFLPFRDVVLPAVEKYVGTSNYDDDILRTLSLVRQMDVQHAKGT